VKVSSADDVIRKDATSGWTRELTDAATDLIWPLIASEVLTVKEWDKTLKSRSVL